MAAIASELADFVTGTRVEDLPDRLVERVKIHALDALACGFVGARMPWALMVDAMVAAQGGAEEASVFGREGQVSASQGALLNGVMISGFESEHSGHHSHSAATVTPAALAMAERERVSGRELLAALAVGPEVGCRIGDAQTRAVEDERGFHNPGVNGPFAAAAAAGRLLGLDAASQAHAFGIAGSHSAGLVEYAWDGSMTKRLHLGRASQHGLECAVLAAQGFTGPVTIIEGRYGLLNAFSPAPKLERALAGLGEEWRVETTMIKPYAAHGSAQAVIAAVQDLKRGHEFDPAAIQGVRVRSSDHRVELERFRGPAPTTMLGAQCSLPFTTAVALVRDLGDPLRYDLSTLEDELIGRIATVVSFEMIEEVPAHVEGSGPEVEIEVTTTDGRRFEVQIGAYRGSIGNLASFDDVEDKFHRFSKHLLDEGRRKQVVAMVRGLETLDDATELTALLRP